MPNLNRVMLMGNLTRDPELRHTPKGTAVTDIGLAVNRYYSGDDGQRREETTFVDVTLWGRQAEVVCQYCHKGRPLYVEGRLNLDTWEDRNTGQARSKLRVVGENIQLLGSRDGGGQQGGGGGGGYQQQGQAAYQPPPQQGSGYQAPPQQQQQQQAPPPQQQQPAYQAPPQQQQQQQPQQPAAASSPAQNTPMQDDDDDIPF